MLLSSPDQIAEYLDIVEREYPEGVLVPNHQRTHVAEPCAAGTHIQVPFIVVLDPYFILSRDVPVEQVLVQRLRTLEHQCYRL